MTVLGKGFWRLLFLFFELFTFMCIYVLGLIELELYLKLSQMKIAKKVCPNIWSFLYICLYMCCCNLNLVFEFLNF